MNPSHESPPANPPLRSGWWPLARAALATLWRGLRHDRRYQVAAAVLLLGGLAIVGYRVREAMEAQARAEKLSYEVTRTDLQVSVLEGGNVASTNNFEIKSEVEGQTSIISVIPDGTMISEEDVKNAKILAELDSAVLREKLAQQEIAFNDANAAYAQARETFEIQKNQSESNIKEGELKGKFGRMDLEKYLGTELAEKLLKSEVDAAAIMKGAATDAKPGAATAPPALNGEALQKWRKLKADIDLAGEEVSRARDRVDWSKKLGPPEQGGNGYITRGELEADNLALKRKETEADQAILALSIFIDYEFPKEAVKLFSDYTEACRELERIKAKARAEIAKAEAEKKSKEAGYNLQKDRLDKAKRLVDKCVFRATKAGMVVYPSTQNFWDQNKIEQGAMVRERQIILTMPDPAKMGIIIRVHESMVDKVKLGQRARIVLDAFPDQTLWGKVDKVAILPDTQNPWMNPDLKVYSTTIAIDNPSTLLKTGLSAKVEIIIDTLKGVLVVPVQAVTSANGRRLCYVLNGSRPEKRVVETGGANDKFIQIVSGLRAGEKVLLQPPEPVVSDNNWSQNDNAKPADVAKGDTAAKPEAGAAAKPAEAPKPAAKASEGKAP